MEYSFNRHFNGGVWFKSRLCECFLYAFDLDFFFSKFFLVSSDCCDCCYFKEGG